MWKSAIYGDGKVMAPILDENNMMGRNEKWPMGESIIFSDHAIWIDKKNGGKNNMHDEDKNTMYFYLEWTSAEVFSVLL